MPFLVPGLYSGLTNQLLSFYGSFLLAKQQNWTLVLPHWMLEFNDFQSAKSIPFPYFLRVSVEQTKFKFSKHLPREYFPSCLGQLQCSSTFSDCQYPSLQIMKQFALNHGVVCMSAHTTYFGLQRINNVENNVFSFVNAPGLVDLRKILHVSPLFQNITSTVKNKLLSVYGTDSYISLHARIENDFVQSCKIWKREGRNDGRNTNEELRVCFEDDETFYSSLKTFAPNNSIVIIMSDTKMKLEETFPLTCGGHCVAKPGCFVFQCTSKQALISTYPSELLASQTAYAMVDFSIAIDSTIFFGNLYSSMSTEIFIRHLSQNKTAHFYNRKCSEVTGKCP